MYDKKLKEYKEQQDDLLEQMKDHAKADQNFYLTASRTLDLAKRAYQIFESSEQREKRQFLNYLLQNCRLSGKTLMFELRIPFNGIVAYHQNANWYGFYTKIRTDFAGGG